MSARSFALSVAVVATVIVAVLLVPCVGRPLGSAYRRATTTTRAEKTTIPLSSSIQPKRYIHRSSPQLRALRSRIISHQHLLSTATSISIPDVINPTLLTPVRQEFASPSPSPSFNASTDHLGYSFAPCSYHDNCQPSYLCLRGDMTASCSGRSGCICFSTKGPEWCDGTCKSCNNYPLETCTYLVGDEADGVTTSEETYEGVCASTALVYIGFLVELGECQTFSDLGITPAPDVEDELEKEKEKETGKDNETDEMKAEASLTLTPTPTSTTTPTVSSSSSNSSTNSNTEQNRENDEDGTNNNSTNDESITTPPSSVCIAADMLSHLPFDSLVFSTHRRAAVLCDTFGSCATPEHIVVHDGRAMTMRQYCETAGCKRTVKLVNSPRIGKGVKTRVGSRSPQMEFTALAARFDTFVERWALRMVVERFGF